MSTGYEPVPQQGSASSTTPTNPADGWGVDFLRLAPGALLLMALGVALVADAYAAGRAQAGWGEFAFWAGQLLVIVPVVGLFVFSRAISRGTALLLVTALAVATSVIRFTFSPLMFRFADEFQHQRTAEDILRTQELFTPNAGLPVSPLYPGTEILATAFANLSGASIFVSATLVVAASHAIVAPGLYLLYREIGGRERTAAIATAIYAMSPHFASINVMFLYQAVALPLMVLALLCVAKLVRDDLRTGELVGWSLLALILSGGVVVTHHVTSAALLAFLMVIAATALLRRRDMVGARPLMLCVVVAAAIGVWASAVAPEVVSYLAEPAERFTSGVDDFGQSDQPGARPLQAPPFERALIAVSVLIMLVGLPIGSRILLRRHGWAPLPLAMVVASVSFYGLVLVRLAGGDAIELAGRLTTFAFIPGAMVLAVVFVWLLRTFDRPTGGAVVAITLSVFFIGWLAGGWPPHWGRLPGTFLVGGFERSVSPQGLATAEWASANLGRDNRIGADLSNVDLISTIGEQDGVRQAAPLFHADQFRPRDRDLAQRIGLELIIVDRRMTALLPPRGTYFHFDAEAATAPQPFPESDLRKFDLIPGLSRVYDNGAIAIYDIRGSRYRPHAR